MGIDEHTLHERMAVVERLVADLRAKAGSFAELGPLVTRLEEAIANLRALIGPEPRPWWEKVAISPGLEEDFEEAMRLGREFRKAGRLPDEPPDLDDDRK